MKVESAALLLLPSGRPSSVCVLCAPLRTLSPSDAEQRGVAMAIEDGWSCACDAFKWLGSRLWCV